MKNVFRIALFLLLPFLFAACGPGNTFEQHSDVSTGQWEKSDVKSFTLEVPANAGKQQAFVALRHHGDSPLGVFAMEVSYTLPDGKTGTEQVDFYLRDPETKQFVGEMMGDLGDTQQEVLKDVDFSQAGKYTVKIAQATSKDQVPGIMAVGFVLKKVGK